MNRDRGSGIGEQGAGIGGPGKGFTLVELLISMGITLAVAGAIAALAPGARNAFERLPAELEIQQRGRAAIEALTQAVRAAGKDVAASHRLGAMADLFPAITLSDLAESSTEYRTLTVIVPVVDGAQGVLDANQASGSGPMMLAASSCPNVKDVCGFTAGVAAVVVDGSGQYDVFIVGTTNAGARRLTPASALTHAYGAGSVVVEVEQSTFRLDRQPDGSDSLIRITAGGAVQPVIDHLSFLGFSLAHQQLDIAITARPLPGSETATGERTFKTSIRLRNSP